MNYSSYMHIRHFSPSPKLKVSVILMYCLLLNFALGFAQKESNHLRKGNELYKKEKFSEAELEYRKGLEQKSKSYTGNFNLSNSLYKQQKYKEAAVMLDSLSKTTKDKNQLASVYHNLGNSLLQDKAYAESVEAYKKALKLKPDAEDSRYNLSYAMRKLQQQQQQQQQNQQKQQSKNQDQKQNKDQKPQDKKDQKEEEQRKQNLNREEAEQMLDALNREEKDLRKKTEKKDAKGVPVPSGKDW
jgi:Ca-activated chloride channel family protein